MGISVTLEIITNIATIVAVIISLAGGIFACIKWVNSLKVQRAEQLECLFEKFEANCIFKRIRRADDGVLGDVTEGEKDAMESLFQTIDYLCYLKDEKIIEIKEFNIFKSCIDSFLSNETVRFELLKKDNMDVHPYVYLSRYMAHQEPIEEPNVVTQKTNDFEISKTDFDEPTMIIKINRRYREGMNKDELYDATRQWWAVRVSNAQRMKYALAVVNGRVLEVYKIDSWEKDEDVYEEHGGRYRFKGSVASESKRSKYIGKSVKSLFVKGAVNPIRYFG